MNDMKIYAKNYYGVWRISEDVIFSVAYDNNICQCNVIDQMFLSFIFNEVEAIQIFNVNCNFEFQHFNHDGSSMAIGGMTGVTALFSLFIPGLFFTELSDSIKKILNIYDDFIFFSDDKEQEVCILINNGEIKEFVWKNCDVYLKAVPLFQYGQYDISLDK